MIRNFGSSVVAIAVCAALASDARAVEECGVATSASGPPKAGDALGILRTAVGSRSCDLCVCDVDRSGLTTASDALTTLKSAVGQPVTLKCVACPVSETIGAGGGEVISADGRFELHVPAGALDGDTEITVAGLAPSLAGDDFAGLKVSEIYTIEPDGLELNVPAETQLILDTTTSPDGKVTFVPPVAAVAPSAGLLQTRSARGNGSLTALTGETRFDRDDGPAYVGTFLTTPKLDKIVYMNFVTVSLTLPLSGMPGTPAPVVVSLNKAATPQGEAAAATGTYSDSVDSQYGAEAGAVELGPETIPGPLAPPLQFSVPSVCMAGGPQQYSAGVHIGLGHPAPFAIDINQIFDLIGIVDCQAPVVLRTGFDFMESCSGTVLPMGETLAGPKVLCCGTIVGPPQQIGFQVYETTPDPNDPGPIPDAPLLYDGMENAFGALFKQVFLPAPGLDPNDPGDPGPVHDAVLSTGLAFNVKAFSPEDDKFVTVLQQPGFQFWSDVSLSALPPEVGLLTSGNDLQFSVFDYDGQNPPAGPTELLGPSDFNGLDLDGNLTSGKLRSSDGPLLGVTTGVGQTPGEIVFSSLDPNDPGAPVSVVGNAGVSPSCMHCDPGLCIITNGGDDTMTLVTWAATGTPSIIGTVSIGDNPNGAEVFPLGGTRHLVISAGRDDDTLNRTVVDTGAVQFVESNHSEHVPSGCSMPTFVHVIDPMTRSFVVSCTGSKTIVVYPGDNEDDD